MSVPCVFCSTSRIRTGKNDGIWQIVLRCSEQSLRDCCGKLVTLYATSRYIRYTLTLYHQPCKRNHRIKLNVVLCENTIYIDWSNFNAHTDLRRLFYRRLALTISF